MGSSRHHQAQSQRKGTTHQRSDDPTADMRPPTGSLRSCQLCWMGIEMGTTKEETFGFVPATRLTPTFAVCFVRSLQDEWIPLYSRHEIRLQPAGRFSGTNTAAPGAAGASAADWCAPVQRHAVVVVYREVSPRVWTQSTVVDADGRQIRVQYAISNPSNGATNKFVHWFHCDRYCLVTAFCFVFNSWGIAS